MTEERKKRYDFCYMNMAKEIAQLSYARRNQVGAIIVSKEGQIVSQGFNGTPNGFPNECEYVNEAGELVTKEEVLHAESNAISKCAKYYSSTKNSTLYITLSPCIECAKLIIQSEISRVVFLEKYRCTHGVDLLLRANIAVDQLDEINNAIIPQKIS